MLDNTVVKDRIADHLIAALYQAQDAQQYIGYDDPETLIKATDAAIQAAHDALYVLFDGSKTEVEGAFDRYYGL